MPEIDLTQIKLTLILEENQPPKVEIESGGLTGSFPFPLTGDSFVVRPSASVSIALALKGIYTDTNGDGLPDQGNAGGGGGTTPELVLDFDNEVYSLNGVTKTATEVLSSDATYSSWDGVELPVPDFTGPVVASSAASEYLAGCTVIVDWTNSAASGGAIEFTHMPDYVPDYALILDSNAVQTIGTGEPTSIAVSAGLLRVAATLSNAGWSVSINGDAVVVYSDILDLADVSIIGFNNSPLMQKVRIIPPVPDADLPALSAL